MKVLFLDIDGVLNSAEYDREKHYGDPVVDRSRMKLLQALAERTGAVVVLTSSWRVHWEVDESLCDETGREMNALFSEYGLRIVGKTPRVKAMERPREVRSWLEEHAREVESYVILDDMEVDWEEMRAFAVKTDYYIGRGLEQWHVMQAIDILEGK